MSKTNEDLAIQILSAQIQKIVQHMLGKAGFDRTVPGIVSAVLGNHKYKVKIKKEEYIMSSQTDMTYQVNEAVWVCIPSNNMQNRFISGRRRS